MVLRRVSE